MESIKNKQFNIRVSYLLNCITIIKRVVHGIHTLEYFQQQYNLTIGQETFYEGSH